LSAEAQPPPRWFLRALAALFFASGVSALIYQVLWLRLLGLVFGVTVYAASTVWASFMAGLAIGSLAAGRIADRVRNPLKWFGAAEMLISVTALATPLAFEWMPTVYVRVYALAPNSLALLTLARFAMTFAVLIVPTALMGATLPLVIKSSAFRTQELGERIGLLYSANTAGAIVGTLAAGLYLIPGPGIHRTFLLAAGLNLLVGGLAIVLGSSQPRLADSTATAVESAKTDHALDPPSLAVNDNEPAHDASKRRREGSLVLIVFALSGLTSLALEVVWFRVLTLFLRPTVYGFAVMLATILAGIAFGSYVVRSVLDRRARWIAMLAGLELAIGIAVVLSFRPLAQMSPLTAAMRPWLATIVPDYLVFPIAGSLLAIFPTAVLLGIAFPIGLRVWTTGGGERRRGIAAQRIGVFYSVNVAGSILGSLVAGFFLLPRLGSRSSLILLAAISFGSGLLLLAVCELHRSLRGIVAVAASIVFAFAVVRSPEPFDEFVRQRYPRQRIVWREEGVGSTVVVHQAAGEIVMTVNGVHQASTGAAMAYVHHRIGHLPMAVHPEARDALVIGLGGGATAGAVSLHHGVQVDVVELSAAVVHGAQFFDTINYGVLSRPNVRMRIDDGRNYMMVSPRKYDVVAADVIHPIYAGAGNLYSAEYFELIRRVLKPGGLVLQWVAGTDAEYKLIARTFLSVFPQTTVWADGTLLLGAVEPLRLSRDEFERKLRTPGSAQGLHDLGVETFDRLLTLFRAGPDDLRSFVGPGPILSDDRPLVEYFLSLPRDRDVDLSPLRGDVSHYVVND
jgi:spermidine synthase